LRQRSSCEGRRRARSARGRGEVRGQERLPCSSAGTHLVTRKVVQVALTKGAARTVRCTHCSRLSARQRRCWAVGAALCRLALLRLPLEAPARRRWTERRMGCGERGCAVAGHRAGPRRCAGSGGMHTAAALAQGGNQSMKMSIDMQRRTKATDKSDGHNENGQKSTYGWAHYFSASHVLSIVLFNAVLCPPSGASSCVATGATGRGGYKAMCST
jgi:hypothetical protein